MHSRGRSTTAPIKPARRGPGDPLGTLGLLLYFACAVVPMAAAFGYAAAYSLGLTGLLSEGLTVRAWTRALTDPATWHSFALSLAIAAATVVMAAAAGMLLALTLGHRLARGPLSYVAYTPLALPFTVAAFVVFQWLTPSGLLARAALWAGLIDELDAFVPLVNDPYGIGILVTHVLIAAPFLALVFQRLIVQERVPELQQLSSTLGASRLQTLVRVTAPLLVRRGASNLALIFVVVLGSYEVPLLLGRQAPQMLSVLIMRKYGRFDIEDKPEAFALAALYTAVVVAGLALVFRSREGSRATSE
jgi:putative spermidine/putrescine transport system permease protein